MNLKTPSNLSEIIIVDNGSTDIKAFIVKKYQDENSNIDNRYFYDSNPGLLTGLHLGAEE
jgi:glycosyltransferase involved in cell wall biosynthesis